MAGYTYDDDEQRIVKSGGVDGDIHYHYDSEGRLIAETNGTTGDTIREYFWLGLTPLAVYDAANDNDDGCNDALLAELQARLLARQDRLVLVSERILVVSGNLDGVAAREASVATRKAELEAILAGVNPTNTDRIASLTERIATLETRLTDLESRITNLETRIEDLNARVTRLEAAIVRISERIDRVQARCDAGTGGGTTTAQLYFLHSDHLGKTKFATDSTGTVVWDGGINTPFGESVTLASAFAQNLMFPGQYRDDESGLSHNWHRTYDPTLGRYLQSDPIGLAGGINRYAYVGGNPLSFVDPEGLSGILTIYARDGNGGIGHMAISFNPDGPIAPERLQKQCGCETFDFVPTGSSPYIPWPNSPSGLLRNRRDLFDKKFVKFSVRIDDEQEKRMRKRIKKWSDKRYTVFGNACSHFAIDVWNHTTGDNFLPLTFLPASSANLIERRNRK